MEKFLKENLGPPLRMIAPGRVFRNETVDASHEHTFYQLEGMMIDRNVSVGNLIYFMKTLLTAIFHRDVTVRLRPGFFASSAADPAAQSANTAAG
jgi:phenylalanyl-tRNA synthetase alpha chain